MGIGCGFKLVAEGVNCLDASGGVALLYRLRCGPALREEQDRSKHRDPKAHVAQHRGSHMKSCREYKPNKWSYAGKIEERSLSHGTKTCMRTRRLQKPLRFSLCCKHHLMAPNDSIFTELSQCAVIHVTCGCALGQLSGFGMPCPANPRWRRSSV